MFEEAWEIYPRKVAKKHGEKAWKTAIRRAKPETIIQALKSFAATRHGKDQTYTPHLATWLNGDRWLDFASQASPQSTTTSDELKRQWVNKGRYGAWIEDRWVTAEVTAGRIIADMARKAGYPINETTSRVHELISCEQSLNVG